MDKSNLADQFPEAMGALKNILGSGFPDRLARLDEIYKNVESAWESNIERLQGKPIQYLLIAEAAPWTDTGISPRYFYKSLEGPWVGRILRTFFSKWRPDAKESLSEFTNKTLLKLADKGFLLVDTLPFALKYSTAIRREDDYLELLKASKDHFIKKLNESGLTWHKDVKVALAFKWNGLRVIDAYERKIELSDSTQTINKELNECLIAVDGSNYTSTKRLLEIYGLPTPNLGPGR